MQSPPADSTVKTCARTVSSDHVPPTIVLNVPGVRLTVLPSTSDSLLHLDIALSSAASLLLAMYIVCVLAWNVVSVALVLLAQAAALALISFYTYTSLAVLSMDTNKLKTSQVDNTFELETKESPATVVVAPTLPLLCIDGASSLLKRTGAIKSNPATAIAKKEVQTRLTARHVQARVDRNHLLVNVVPGDSRRRVDMDLGKANIRIGKAFVQTTPGTRQARDIYVVRVDCGAQSAALEKHMNPVIMWDVTATFEEFKRLERDLQKELKAKKQSHEAKVPHLSRGIKFFVERELTVNVLDARRVRLQAFIDVVRSDPVLSTMGCLRKFCQAY
uniref:PX domain-containing protein n=1 Tax=Hyaloperonospora arabidopsidis (strain Emoy2) TaxID=559515 RepID=M4BIE2_HYAAE